MAQQKRESELLLSRTGLVLGIMVLVIGLGLALYGANNYAILNCSSISCFAPQYVVDQIRTSGFRAAYVASQETAYAGMLLFAFGSMGVAFWKTHGLRLSQRLVLVLLVGVFLLVFVTALAIADGFIPFGQRIIFQQ